MGVMLMAEYLSPGVYVEEFDNGYAPVQGVGTSTAGFIGVAYKGVTSGGPVLVTNQADFARKFGSYLQENEFSEYRYLAYSVNHFFINGGERAFIMRVAPSDAKTAISKGVNKTMKFSAKDQGVWGNGVSLSFNESSKAKSQVLETISEGNYVLKNAADFNVGDVVLLESKTIKEYNIVVGVDGNAVFFEKPFENDPTDTNILPTITVKTCEFNVEVKYDEIAETYVFLSFNINIPNFIEKKMSKSELVNVKALAGTQIINPIELIKECFESEKETVKILLKGGLNGSKSALSDADFIGEDKGPGSRTGIQAFLDNSDVSIIAVPGITSPNVQLSLVSHCERLGSRFAVLDVPMTSKSVSDIMKHRNIVDSDYAAMYHPWLKVFDSLDKKNIYIPPSGAIIGIYARSDNTRGVHSAPANETVSNCTGLYCNYNTGEHDLLNSKGVNLIRTSPGAGIRVWGARTTTSAPQWKYIKVRRLFIFLEETIKANTNWVVFEPNDEMLWIRVKRIIEVFLKGLWRSGALAGETSSDAFFVDIGSRTMSKDDIDNGRLICVIGVAPVKPAEFIIFRITQKTGIN